MKSFVPFLIFNFPTSLRYIHYIFVFNFSVNYSITSSIMRKETKCAINKKLFEIIGFQRMIDPYGSKIFGYNTFNLINVILIILTSTITTIG